MGKHATKKTTGTKKPRTKLALPDLDHNNSDNAVLREFGEATVSQIGA